MTQKTGKTSRNSNINMPLPINEIASQIGTYFEQLKKWSLPYNIDSNYAVKRKFMCIVASLKKCYYLDIEFPYFVKYKKEKFNWKAFINKFGSANLEMYVQMCNNT